eukprot:799075-Prymnesium_polylepis.2
MRCASALLCDPSPPPPRLPLHRSAGIAATTVRCSSPIASSAAARRRCCCPTAGATRGALASSCCTSCALTWARTRTATRCDRHHGRTRRPRETPHARAHTSPGGPTPAKRSRVLRATPVSPMSHGAALPIPH